MHTFQPDGEEGAVADRTTAAIGQEGGQDRVMGKHPVDQR